MSRHRFVLLALLLAGARPLWSQSDSALPSDVTFNLRRSFLEELRTGGRDSATVGARWTVTLKMGEHSAVHTLAKDCEIHIGAKLTSNRKLANPSSIVVEPPNVCKFRVPQISQTGTIKAAWEGYFTNQVRDQTCAVTGFPRIFSEHASGGGEGGSNPDHVLEVHPTTSIECGDQRVDFLPNLKYVTGLRAITPLSAAACLEHRRLFVRQRGGTAQNPRYEFNEEGAKGAGGRCGNFIIVDAQITKEYLRTLSNGDHTALARVWVGENGPFPLKVYTYNGTPVNHRIAALMADADDEAFIELQLHGLVTYDYFTIIQTLQRAADDGSGFVWLPKEELTEWREVRRPLSLVVFGIVD